MEAYMRPMQTHLSIIVIAATLVSGMIAGAEDSPISSSIDEV
jgi:hypothetical protein